MTIEQIERIGQLLAGDGPGWQSRFAAMIGISRGHFSNVLTGTRALTPTMEAMIGAAMQSEIRFQQRRVAEIEALLATVVAQADTPTQGDDE